MHPRSGYVAKTPRLLMEWSFSVLKQIKNYIRFLLTEHKRLLR